jgi:chromatin remodeling complex protein RSC6
MWEYFREKDLLDPKDKRFVIFDETMRAVFGVKRLQVGFFLGNIKNCILFALGLKFEIRVRQFLEPSSFNQNFLIIIA